jgi:hypothetical protein
MKKSCLFLISCQFILLISCQEKEDPFTADIIGTWEIANYDESLGLTVVATYIFEADGTYSYKWTYREQEGNENIGYQLIWKGNFRTSGERLTLMPQQTFYPPVGVNRPPFVPKDQMVQQEFTPGQRDNKRFSISKESEELKIFADTEISEDEIYSKVK